VATVRDGFGAGDTVFAAEALALGMIDRIATLDDTIERAATGVVVSPRLTAQRTEAAQVALAPFQERLAQATLAAHKRTLALHNVGH
jgi:ClpP class serine protease